MLRGQTWTTQAPRKGCLLSGSKISTPSKFYKRRKKTLCYSHGWQHPPSFNLLPPSHPPVLLLGGICYYSLPHSFQPIWLLASYLFVVSWDSCNTLVRNIDRDPPGCALEHCTKVPGGQNLRGLKSSPVSGMGRIHPEEGMFFGNSFAQRSSFFCSLHKGTPY